MEQNTTPQAQNIDTVDTRVSDKVIQTVGQAAYYTGLSLTTTAEVAAVSVVEAGKSIWEGIKAGHRFRKEQNKKIHIFGKKKE